MRLQAPVIAFLAANTLQTGVSGSSFGYRFFVLWIHFANDGLIGTRLILPTLEVLRTLAELTINSFFFKSMSAQHTLAASEIRHPEYARNSTSSEDVRYSPPLTVAISFIRALNCFRSGS